MKRSFLVTVFLRLTLAMAFVAVTRALVPQKDWYITVLAVIGWAAVAAVWTTCSVRQAIAPLQRAAAAIAETPEVGSARLRGEDYEPGYKDFAALSKALAGAAGQVEQSLAQSKESRRELEALLDSMQDAVIAVDSAGRIQWTNQRMQKLIPGATVSGAVRVGPCSGADDPRPGGAGLRALGA